MPCNPYVHTDSRFKGRVPRHQRIDAAVGEATILIVLHPQPLIVLVLPCFANHISPGGHLSHFLQLSLWNCVLTLTDEYQLLNNIYICPIIDPEVFQLWPLNTVSHSLHLHHKSEMLGIALVVHTPTYTSWNWIQSMNNARVHAYRMHAVHSNAHTS